MVSFEALNYLHGRVGRKFENVGAGFKGVLFFNELSEKNSKRIMNTVNMNLSSSQVTKEEHISWKSSCCHAKLGKRRAKWEELEQNTLWIVNVLIVYVR